MGKTNQIALTDVIWIVLLVFLVIGWFYPVVGLIAVICMAAPVVYGFWKGGRVWCGSFCPRGSFLGKLIGKMSTKGKLPAIISNKHFRNFVLVFLLSYFTYGVIKAGGNLEQTGFVFFRTILVTTLVGIGLGIKYQPRTWCKICPMGTLSHYAAQTKKGMAFKREIQNGKKEGLVKGKDLPNKK